MYLDSSNHFKQIQRKEGILLNSLSEASITLIPKPDKDISLSLLSLSLSVSHTHTHTYSHTNYRPISLMNIHVKILNKILANQIQQYLKIIIHLEQVRFILGCEDGSLYTNLSM